MFRISETGGINGADSLREGPAGATWDTRDGPASALRDDIALAYSIDARVAFAGGSVAEGAGAAGAEMV